MPAQAMGPTYARGSQPIIKDGYSILYLPDVNNPAAPPCVAALAAMTSSTCSSAW
ncbi:MAG: hypothetical protein ABIS84_12405 [Arachnia sp.]